MRRQVNPETEQQENPFALSIGDLMAALLLVFVLLLASTLLRLQEEFEVTAGIATGYTTVKESIYKELLAEFEDDLKKWNADLDPINLSIRFNEPDVLFDKNQSTVKVQFRDILDDFFPRYIRVLNNFKDNIEEIRIEGHTDSDGPTRGLNKDHDYIFNMSLSQDRTRSVLQHSLSTLDVSSSKGWVKERLTANGLSSSKPINFNKTNAEDKEASRRVEFRIRTDAEKQIEEIIEKTGRR